MALAGPRAWPHGEPAGEAARASYALLLVFLLLAAGIVAAGYLYFRNYENHYRIEVEHQLSAIAELKTSELVRFRTERLGDAAILFRNASFSAIVRRVLDDPGDGEAKRQLLEWLEKFQRGKEYDQVRLIDARGATRMAIPAAQSPLSTDISGRVHEILRSGKVFFQDFYRNEHDLAIYLAVLVPVPAAEDDRRTVGVLRLRIDPETHLIPFLRRWPTSSRTGETLLLRRDGDDALFLNEPRFRKDAALAFRTPLEEGSDNPVVKAVLGREGIVEGVDYRGVPVTADVRAVPGSTWFLVTKMDQSEVYAPVRERLWWLVVLVSVLLVGAAAGVGAVRRKEGVRFYRERYEAAETLRESEEKFRLLTRQFHDLLDTIPDNITRQSPDLRVIWANRAAAARVRKEPPDLIGSYCYALYHNRTSPCEVCPIQETFRTGKPALETVTTHDGRTLELRTVPVMEDGRVVEVVEIGRDVTESRKLEEQFRQAQKMEAVGRLAGGVAHDFNNMLNVILGYADLALTRVDPGDPLAHALQEIQKAGHRSADLTRQLLAFSRKQIVAPKVLNLNKGIEDQLKMMDRLIGEEIRIDFLPAGDLWNVRIDPSQVSQIVANLSVNARDAIAGVGTITIETANVIVDEAYCREHPYVEPGEYAMASFTDTGAGMDEATRERIFEPFFTTKGEGKGTGLGMSTVYGIVKQNGGFVHVYSEPGQGTTIRVHFPRVQGETENLVEKEEEGSIGGTETVLIVEDEEQILLLSRRILERFGYRVLAAGTPEEALRLAEEQEGDIHLLLTDVILPEMNGKELEERIEAVRPGIRTLFMSGYTADAIARRGILEKGLDFLQKPFTLTSLGRKVRQVLDSGKS
jgi:signal transduction histidine kinase